MEHARPKARCTSTACGARLVKIGEETSEQLDYQPASLFVTEHVRFTYACHACEGTVMTAELPAAPIEKGRPGPGLLAQVITAKYADHLPLNRQAEIFARHGVTLARQTLCDWVATAAAVLTPLYEDLKAAVLTSKVIHTDDTVVPVLDRHRTETREGRLWVYVGDGRPADLVYDYTADRTRAGPIAFLGDFRGYLQADAYAGYDAVYATGRVVEVACKLSKDSLLIDRVREGGDQLAAAREGGWGVGGRKSPVPGLGSNPSHGSVRPGGGQSPGPIPTRLIPPLLFRRFERQDRDRDRRMLPQDRGRDSPKS